jgi:hypothetical protein
MPRATNNERARKAAATGPRRGPPGACPAAQPMLQPSPRRKEGSGWTEPS